MARGRKGRGSRKGATHPGSRRKATDPPAWDYLAAADRLKASRRELPAAFSRPLTHQDGCLFHVLSPDRRTHRLTEHGLTVGCPVQVASRTHFVAWGRDCTRRVLSLGLPRWAGDLTPEQLDEIADVQLEADLTFRSRKWRDEFPAAVVAAWPSDRVEVDDDVDWF